MTLYYFDPDVAKEFGMAAAVLFQNIVFWIKKNEANKQKSHYHKDRYWTYNSIDAFIELFPFMKRYTIKKSLKLLEEKGMILIDKFNEESFDHTQWYALGDLGQKVADEQSKPTIVRNQPNDCAKTNNRKVENEQPIPYIERTNNKQENISSINNSIYTPNTKEGDKKKKSPQDKLDGNKKSQKKKDINLDFVKPECKDAFEMWLEYHRQIKKPYKSELALKRCYSRLEKLSGNNPKLAMAIVEQSIANNYQGLFSLKDSGIPNQSPNLFQATDKKLGPGEKIGEDGRRYYLQERTGKPIYVPNDAPPRPSTNHVWVQSYNAWIVP